MTDEHIVVVGLMGAGKTTVGRALAARLDREFVDCDEALTARSGTDAATIAGRDGLGVLHALEADVLLDALDAAAPSVVAAAASTIEDARCRAALRAAFVVWLRADAAVLASRVGAQGHRPLRDDPAAQLAEHRRRRDPLFAGVADLVVDVDDRAPGDIIAHILAAVA